MLRLDPRGLVRFRFGLGERQIPPTAALAREILEGLVPAEAAPPKRAPVRSSGIVAPSASGARSREKMIWEWPEVGDRLVEDWR